MSISGFSSDSAAVIVGASRGIGLALVEAIANDGRFSEIIATSRNGRTANSLNELAARAPVAVRILDMDLSCPESIARVAGHMDATNLRPALVLNVAGLLHDRPGVSPEKRLEDLDPTMLERVFAVNTIGPALVMKHFLPRMAVDRRSVLAVLSARVGSIADNRLGGWYAYRASKAALNQMVKTAAIESQRRFGNVILAALHPGTTDTDLSRPFQANVPEGKLFSPAFVAARLMAVIEGLENDDSGGFFAWDGSSIQW